MIKALRERGPDTPVVEVMRSDIPVVESRRSLEEALQLMQGQRLPAVGVADRAGRVVGLVTPENIGEMLMIQSARLERRPGVPWWPSPPPRPM
jgi:stage IV sporulation protein FB